MLKINSYCEMFVVEHSLYSCFNTSGTVNCMSTVVPPWLIPNTNIHPLTVLYEMLIPSVKMNVLHKYSLLSKITKHKYDLQYN